MTPQRVAETDRLIGYTTVSALNFRFDPVLSVCDLALHLENPTTQKTVTLFLKEVTGLRLSEFGGGLTQLLFLMIEDVQAMQLDRINFRVREVERGTLECQCRNFEITE